MYTREIIAILTLVVILGFMMYIGSRIVAAVYVLETYVKELKKENTELGHLIEWMDNCLPQK